MRPLAEIQADLAALGRPRMPVGVDPKAIEAWRVELAAWNAAHPGRQADYVALLDEWDAYDAAQAERHAGAAALTRAGVPSRVLTAALAARETPAVALAREWLAGPKPWLVLMGGTGVGKSVAAAVALVDASKARQSCLWVPAVELATRAGGFDGVAFGLRCKGADVLVLDDVGMEHGNDFARSVLSEVLQHRHENEARTVITTNLSGADFARRLDARLVDRIRSACVSKALVGPSLRGEP